MTETPDPRTLVSQGYDRIADRYAQWTRDDVTDEARPRYTQVLLDGLPAGAPVLELGCGGGGPTTRALAGRFRLTGVDISPRQIELARAIVPHANLILDDITRVDFPPASFDAVASFYTFLHLPPGELSLLIRKIGEWLKPGGLFVATMALGTSTGGVEPDFLGTPMFFSGYSAEDNERFVREAGLEITQSNLETNLENSEPVRFLWIVARKRSSAVGAASLQSES
jgi:SAM-dependent methyltransferase